MAKNGAESLSRARRYAREIVPAFNVYAYFRFGYWIARNIARSLIRVRLGYSDEEVAAVTLGAQGRHTFFWVTLPNIIWALLYGVLLCNARAMGEFGAVSVVSGHIARALQRMMP